ncbi:MAG TPA: hypothetical protein VF721_15055 [Pyrinomonadaceae bacterium]
MKIKIWMVMLLAAVLILPSAVSSVSAQDGKDKTQKQKKDDASKKKSQSFTLKAVKGTVERGGTDPNIKDDSTSNNANAEFVGPKEKTGATNTRGAAGVCKVVLDNQTNLKIKIFVDGSFRGVMAPYGDSVTYTGSGLTRVYARAEFDDGTFIYWGPKDYNCYDGQFIYFKMER